jgi:hypothetical protein
LDGPDPMMMLRDAVVMWGICVSFRGAGYRAKSSSL